MVRRKSVGMLEELDGRSASASERIVSTWMWGCSANWFGCVWNPRITHRSLMVIDRTSLKWHQSQTEYLPVKTQINSAIVGWNILFHLIGCGVWGQLNTRGHFSNCYNLQEPRDNLQEQRTFCFQNIREATQIRVGHADASADAHWMILWSTLLLWIRQTFAYAHWGEAPPLFRVWKIIGWNGILKNHMLTHSGEKSHRCTQCKKTNQESGDLRAHFLIHTGEKLIQLPDPIQEHTLRHK